MIVRVCLSTVTHLVSEQLTSKAANLQSCSDPAHVSPQVSMPDSLDHHHEGQERQAHVRSKKSITVAQNTTYTPYWASATVTFFSH